MGIAICYKNPKSENKPQIVQPNNKLEIENNSTQATEKNNNS